MLHLLRTVLSSRLIHMWCSREYLWQQDDVYVYVGLKERLTQCNMWLIEVSCQDSDTQTSFFRKIRCRFFSLT